MSELSKALKGLEALKEPAPRISPARKPAERPTASAAKPAVPSLAFSPQQEAVLDAVAPRLEVVALAGTGKTTVLMEYARRRPRARWRYLTFSRALADEAKALFPSNVRAGTFHALAHPRFGAPLGAKLNQRFDAQAVRRLVGWEDFPGWETAVAALREWRAGFLSSPDPLPSLSQLPPQAWAWLVARPGLLEAIDGSKGFMVAAERLWEATIDPRVGSIDAPGDTSVKLMALAGMDFGADGLLVDEAQDMTACIAHALGAQRAPALLVGDPSQNLYAWRGAGTAWSPSGAMALTGSFRFGEEVAGLANAQLARLGRVERLQGLREESGIVAAQGEALSPGTTCLARTQAGAMQWALKAKAQGMPVRWVGKGTLRRLASLVDMAQGRPSRDPWLSGLDSIDAVAQVAQESGAKEWRAAARLVMKEDASRLQHVLGELSQGEGAKDGIWVATVHQAKGKTFARVRLSDDLRFADPSEEEMRVCYVALTRSAHLEASPTLLESACGKDVSPPIPSPSLQEVDDGF